jgi:hypothetical protein
MERRAWRIVRGNTLAALGGCFRASLGSLETGCGHQAASYHQPDGESAEDVNGIRAVRVEGVWV